MSAHQPPQDSAEALAAIRRLSPAQQEVLGWIAINQDGGHPSRTLQALRDRGLIERETVKNGALTYYRHHVPVYVHIAWCQWCSEQPDPEDEPDSLTGKVDT